MKKNNKTTVALSAAVLALLLLGTGCSKDNGSSPSPTASPSVSASPAASSGPDASQETATETASPNASPTTSEATGKYTGLQDSHTIEITTDKGPTAFQVSPEIADKVDPWDAGTPVKFQYVSEKLDVNGEQVEQLTIISIDKQ